MGTVIQMKVPHVRDVTDEYSVSHRPRRTTVRRVERGTTLWTPGEAARAWWEMTLIKSTLEALCELTQQALDETADDGWPPASELQSAFSELKAATEQVGSVCQDEVHALLHGDAQSLTFSWGVDAPEHLRVIREVGSVTSISPSYRQLNLCSQEMARLAVQVLEQSVIRFGDAIACLSVTIGADGPLSDCGDPARFARDTAALTRLQILAQGDKALCSQAGALPARVYRLLNQ